MTELKVLKPVVDLPEAGGGFTAVPRSGLAGKRIVVIDNGKPRAAELLGAMAAAIVADHGADAFTVFSKPGASQPISDDDIVEIAASGDLVLTGLGDCGGCSACSLQDALLMERAGRPATVVISEPFQGRIAGLASKLGAPDFGVVVVPHPVATRSSEDLAQLAGRMTDRVALLLGGASA